MMPWPLFNRFLANGRQLRAAIAAGTDTREILAEQAAIMREWDEATPDACESTWKGALPR
jgi:hypothetical protein